MRLHGQYWQALPAQQKQSYEQRAIATRGEQQVALVAAQDVEGDKLRAAQSGIGEISSVALGLHDVLAL